jgi:hypothetical protein
MFTELTRRTEFTKFVANHVLGNVNWNMDTTVMNGEVSSDHFRCNGAGASPRLNDSSVIWTKGGDFFGQFRVNEWAFFE